MNCLPRREKNLILLFFLFLLRSNFFDSSRTKARFIVLAVEPAAKVGVPGKETWACRGVGRREGEGVRVGACAGRSFGALASAIRAHWTTKIRSTSK